MRCIVLFYIICLYLRLIELSPTKRPLKGRRIIGGEDADETKYPYIVRLQFEILIFDDVSKSIIVLYVHACTGAVINPAWTLTAAHCLNDIKKQEPKIVMGDLKTKVDESEIKITDLVSKVDIVIIYGPWNNARISKVIYSVIHHSFKVRMLDIINDIALIRNKPIRLNQYARISSLDYATIIGHEVMLTGYGIVNDTINSVPVAEDTAVLRKPLQLLDALIVSCEKSETQLIGGMCLARRCAKLSGICPGDSGGPLLHSSGVVGVNSIGTLQLEKFCNLDPYTPFYDAAGVTPTSPYIDWISSTIENGVHRNNEAMIDDTESVPISVV